MIFAPSLLGADLLNLGEEVRRVESWGAEWIHFDQMDGHFVPNISFGPAFVAAVRKKTDLFLDVHLMLSDPMNYIDAFADAGADGITVHAEAAEPAAVLEKIRTRGLRAGICVNPGTPASSLTPLLPMADLALIMTVQPGFGGQKMRRECLLKAGEIRAMAEAARHPVLIEADGGINEGNAREVLDAGVDVLVMGTGLFRAEDPAGVIAEIRGGRA